ncbi:MAG: flagellar basal body P-ring formation protein FlgA [Betaproteobacteria bacterium]|nr:flagellar basal body P-ring formation protein FlgA [Betaproteobacteria bacterium]
MRHALSPTSPRSPSRSRAALRAFWRVGLCAALVAAAPAGAQQIAVAPSLAAIAPQAAAPGSQAGPQPSALADPIDEAVRILAERELNAARVSRTRIDVKVGQFDTRVQLAPCARAEPFVPPGSRLWGRTQVGVRCVSGASWMIRLPVSVSVFAPVAIANASMPAGAPIGPTDVRMEEYDLTRDPAPLVVDAAALVGKQLTRTITAGQAVRVDALRTPPSVNAGDPVQIVVNGQGFSLTSEGVALTPGSEGQPLRARTESGRVVVGILRDRTIELRL